MTYQLPHNRLSRNEGLETTTIFFFFLLTNLLFRQGSGGQLISAPCNIARAPQPETGKSTFKMAYSHGWHISVAVGWKLRQVVGEGPWFLSTWASSWAACASLQHGHKVLGMSILTEQGRSACVFATQPRIHTDYFCHSVLVKAVRKACPDLRGEDTVGTILHEEQARWSKRNV